MEFQTRTSTYSLTRNPMDATYTLKKVSVDTEEGSVVAVGNEYTGQPMILPNGSLMMVIMTEFEPEHMHTSQVNPDQMKELLTFLSAPAIN